MSQQTLCCDLITGSVASLPGQVTPQLGCDADAPMKSLVVMVTEREQGQRSFP